MIPGFGKQSLTVGSDPTCDIVLQGQGVASEHGKLVHQGGGKLIFVNAGTGATAAAGRTLQAGEQVPFDFRTQFQLGEANLPFDHPAISLSLMAQGQTTAAPGQLIIGRDPARASLVLQHPSVSSCHCTLAFDRMMVTDEGSTSGTYVAGARIQANAPTPLPQSGNVHIGPVPIQLSLLMQLARGGQQAPAPEVQQGAPQVQLAAPQAVAQPAAGAQPAQQNNAATAFLAAGAGQAAQGAQAQGAQGAQAQHAQAAQSSGAPNARKHKTVFGQLDFGDLSAGGVKSIGRTEGNNDIVIPHAQVSSRHAEVEHLQGRLYVTDRGSANGTYVRGHRIAPGQKVEIESGEKIYIGPMPLQLVLGAGGAVEVVNEAVGDANWAGRPLYEIEAWSLFLEVPDRDDRSSMKVLLDNISFKALPGDMIALMGPSGAGKTTLLLALNGYMPPTEGLVRINGEDLYNIYDTLRGSIGYVPQDDLVHPELTVWEAVRYSAKFRLPPDYSEEEIDQRVQQTLRDLGLEGVAGLQIGSPDAKTLSGGQRKRVNIALELVTDPVIIYLDEPTSGLAADDAATLISLLNKLTNATGKTIIMTIHQPAKDEYEKFNMALILGYGGVPMYFGSTRPDSYRFFSGWEQRQGGFVEPPVTELVDNPRDMFAEITAREDPIYKALLAQDPNTPRATARHQAALIWREEYYSDSNPIYGQMYAGRRAVGTGDGAHGVPERRAKTRGQFRLLLSRYFKTKVRDVSGSVILLAQAPVIAALLAIVFGGQADAVPAWCLGALQQLGQRTGERASAEVFDALASTQDQTGAVFFLTVSAVWFGTSNAAREIVRERSIYLRERMVNLGIVNYVMSKFVLLSFLCVLQCALLLGIVFFALGFNGGMMAFLQELAALTATAVTAVALGLLLSTMVTSSEAAQALTPIALIPQVVLGGLIVPATTIPKLSMLMYAIPTRWGFEAAVIPERAAIADDAAWVVNLGSGKTSAPDFIFDGNFHCATAQMASDSLNGAWSFTSYEEFWIPYTVLGAMTFAALVMVMMILKRRDRI